MVTAAVLAVGAFTCPVFKHTSRSLSDATGSEQASTDKRYATSGPSAEEKASTDKQAQTSNQAPAVAPKAPEIIPAQGNPDDSDCSDRMAAAVGDYNDEVKKHKANLDSRIKFPVVPVDLIAGYVADYNNAVTDLFNDYASQANSAHCTWPLKAPATLPSNYYPN